MYPIHRVKNEYVQVLKGVEINRMNQVRNYQKELDKIIEQLVQGKRHPVFCCTVVAHPVAAIVWNISDSILKSQYFIIIRIFPWKKNTANVWQNRRD